MDALFTALGVKAAVPASLLLPQLRAGLKKTGESVAIELVEALLASDPALLLKPMPNSSSSLLALLFRTTLRAGLIELVLSTAKECLVYEY